jgi:hypothetical protein
MPDQESADLLSRVARLEESLRSIRDIQEALPAWVRLKDLNNSNTAIRRIVNRALLDTSVNSFDA